MAIARRRGREVTAARGTGLRCKGWRQETILRMLENNLENAEDPDNLVIYMSVARAARDWESFDRIVATLAEMEADQTLVVQSGKPVGLFRGQSTTPLVIMANGNIVGGWSDEENRRKLEDLGLTYIPGMTAAAWPCPMTATVTLLHQSGQNGCSGREGRTPFIWQPSGGRISALPPQVSRRALKRLWNDSCIFQEGQDQNKFIDQSLLKTD